MLSVSQRWPHQVQAGKVSLSVNILGLCSSKCIFLLKFPSTSQGRTERVCWVTTWWMLRLCCRVSLWMSKKVTMCWTCVPLQEGKPWLCFSPTPSVRVFVPFVSFHCTSVSPLILSSAFFCLNQRFSVREWFLCVANDAAETSPPQLHPQAVPVRWKATRHLLWWHQVGGNWEGHFWQSKPASHGQAFETESKD